MIIKIKDSLRVKLDTNKVWNQVLAMFEILSRKSWDMVNFQGIALTFIRFKRKRKMEKKRKGKSERKREVIIKIKGKGEEKT